MTKQEQDKLWAELSYERKRVIRDTYKQYSNETDGISQGIVMGYRHIFGEHNLKSMSLTYEDVVKELSAKGKVYNSLGETIHCTSLKQSRKLLSINKLLNVAKLLNKHEDGSNWEPDWTNVVSKFYIVIDGSEILIDDTEDFCSAPVYFRTEEIARQAVQILGEDTIRIALTTDY